MPGPLERLGSVDELWRYPVKSMRGERLPFATFDRSGMVGDRRYAVVSTAAPVGKPLVTSRERTRMLLYQPLLEPTSVVVTPGGERLELPSEALTEALQRELAAPGARLELEHSPDKPIVDVRALSFVSRATLTTLQEELGSSFEPQRLRNNLILTLEDERPYAEEALDGALLRIGDGVGAPLLRVHERIPRCRIVTLDPETAETDPRLLRYLAAKRDGRVSMYATVVQPGLVAEDAVVSRV